MGALNEVAKQQIEEDDEDVQFKDAIEQAEEDDDYAEMLCLEAWALDAEGNAEKGYDRKAGEDDEGGMARGLFIDARRSMHGAFKEMGLGFAFKKIGCDCADCV